jgi:hypothetical protein
MPRGAWVLDPDSGGVKVPEAIKRSTAAHLQQVAEAEFAGRYTRLDIHFRGVFCYVDAYTEPAPPGPNWPPSNWPETTEQYLERLRNTPTHLCRLRYFGPGDRWSFGFYTYSNERYELSFLPSGDFFGTAEDAFRVAAGVYLSGG